MHPPNSGSGEDSERPSFSIGDSEPPSERSTPPGTPTLEQLEDQQAALLKQLEVAGLDANEVSIDSADITGSTPSAKARAKKKTTVKNFNESLDHEGNVIGSASPSTPMAAMNTSTSIGLDYGTPIPDSIAKVEQLPAPSKFADGIQQDIPFENLPNAEGTFKKVMETLKKGRASNKEGK